MMWQSWLFCATWRLSSYFALWNADRRDTGFVYIDMQQHQAWLVMVFAQANDVAFPQQTKETAPEGVRPRCIGVEQHAADWSGRVSWTELLDGAAKVKGRPTPHEHHERLALDQRDLELIADPEAEHRGAVVFDGQRYPLSPSKARQNLWRQARPHVPDSRLDHRVYSAHTSVRAIQVTDKHMRLGLLSDIHGNLTALRSVAAAFLRSRALVHRTSSPPRFCGSTVCHVSSTRV